MRTLGVEPTQPTWNDTMYSITHNFPINAEPIDVWNAVALPEGLDEWWTMTSKGTPTVGSTYLLYFGPEYHWKAEVTRSEPGVCFELVLTEAEEDWKGSVVGFDLEPLKKGTRVAFVHSGWPEANGHYKTSSYCWAMYLRIMKRFVEFGEHVEYSQRLSV